MTISQPNASSSSYRYIHKEDGDLPLILTAPHGGLERPTHIADRTLGCLEHDHDTLDLAKLMATFISKLTGKRCPIVALLLHRIKLDANRGCSTAAEDDSACDVWKAYHGAIEIQIMTAVHKFGFCHVWDIHGQSHRLDASELGYRIFKASLNLSDSQLNADPAIARKSSLAHLLLRKNKVAQQTGAAPITLAQITRGSQSFGAILTKNGYPCTPSPAIPHPGEELDFFSGAFTTVWYGCCGVQRSRSCGGSGVSSGVTPRSTPSPQHLSAAARNVAVLCGSDSVVKGTVGYCCSNAVITDCCNPENKRFENEQEKTCCVGLPFLECDCSLGSVVSVTQIESQSQPRIDVNDRSDFARSLAESIVEFMEINYDIKLSK